MSSTTATRTERDFLGDASVPADAYWGVHTWRALHNFPISGYPIGRCEQLVRSLAWVKKAAARTNCALGVLPAEVAAAIERACDDVIDGALHDQFVVDVIQGGAGTSTNMNANEVLANRALEYLGLERGRYDVVHPNDHVNASQSTNDVYPTALRMAAWTGVGHLIHALGELRTSFERKAAEFRNVLKIGRTQLQDAVPMTLGQEFMAYAVTIGEDEARLREARQLMLEVNLGATAIGTGINAPTEYAARVVGTLATMGPVPVVLSPNLVEATQDTGAFVQLSGVLKRTACKLSKICNDLRLLSSGPQAGFGEIFLPARQAGSSIMPGKVNPVIPETVNQIAFEVIGNDLAITMASEAGQLQLNAFEPIIAWSLFKSVEHLTRGCRTLRENCVEGIRANLPLLEKRVAESVTVATALNPYIGYEAAARIVKHVLAEGGTVSEAAEKLNVLSAGEVARLLGPEHLTGPIRAQARHGV